MISSRPRGASVEIDGRKLAQVTPVVETGLSPDRHTLRLSLANHTTVEEVVDLSGKERDAVDVALAGASRLVEIQTTPRDATVFSNGEMVTQRTPVKLEVASPTLTRSVRKLDSWRAWAKTSDWSTRQPLVDRQSGRG